MAFDRKKYWKEYYAKNKERERQRRKEWYLKQDATALYLKKKARQPANYYTTPERCYKMYKRNAASRNHSFEITLEDFTKFWQLPCYYCRSSIETIGIDRLDNDVGYVLGNLIACCTRCNWMKRSLSSYEFLDACRQIAKAHNESSS